jgi:translation initiation factor IF-3
MFRGRETQHRDIGYQIIQDVIARVAEYGDVEKGTSIEGRDMHAILNAKPKAASKPKKPKTETPQTPAPSAE